MQAIRVHQFGPPEVMKLETLPAPEPGPGQVRVRLRAVGVNPVDTYIRSGQYATLPNFPYTPGTDAAGEIEALGAGVVAGGGVVVGARVYVCGTLTGAYATHCLADASTMVRPLPEHISFEQGAALFVPYYTAFQAAFHRGQVLPGETVLIHGATGGVGLAAVQWLRKIGVTLLATGGTTRGLELLRHEGVQHVFNHREPGYLDAIRAVATASGRSRGGVDVILEMLANVNLPHDLALLAPHGRVVVIGNRGETTINARLTMGKDADIRGMTLWNTTPVQMERIHRAVADGLASGRIAPVIAQRFPLAEAGKAHEAVMTPGAMGKIVLVP